VPDASIFNKGRRATGGEECRMKTSSDEAPILAI